VASGFVAGESVLGVVKAMYDARALVH
jgi:hypothetical protein